MPNELRSVTTQFATRRCTSVEIKHCKGCGQDKPRDAFFKQRAAKDGLQNRCKDCQSVHRDLARKSELAALRYQANKDRMNARNKEWYEANREKVLERQRAHRAAMAEDELASYRRRHRLWHDYRLRPEDYDALLEKQGYVCAVCREPDLAPTNNGDPRNLSVDHDHRCCAGKRSCGRCVRGLLCRACNKAAGLAGDDPVRLRALAAYLEG